MGIQSRQARAADGFDNNYIGGDANQLGVTINGVSHVVLFGPGGMSSPGFYIPIPNGTTNDQGNVSSFTINSAFSYLRSAYLDRVESTTLYYQVHLVSQGQGAWSTVALQPASAPLQSNTCYNTTQDNFWSVSQTINMLAGLPIGNYVLEFYIRSELYDVGDETNPCDINAILQCSTQYIHAGRFISSTFNTTDPTACTLDNTLATQSAPTKITFHVSVPLPLELVYFQGKLRDKNVQLVWETAREQALESFFPERSSDGVEWWPIAEIAAAGNTSTNREYEFLDNQPLNGSNFYRLKARSSDGQVDISPIVLITVTGAGARLVVWPNPVQEILYYNLPKSGEGSLTLRLFNAHGQLLEERTTDDSALSSMSVNNLEEGLYFLVVYDPAGRRITGSRFIKSR